MYNKYIQKTNGDWRFNSLSGELTIYNNKAMDPDLRSELSWRHLKDQIKTVYLYADITAICDYAFCDCKNLREVCIPKEVTTIGNSAFRGCSSLIKISLSDKFKSIGDHAFSDCSSLISVYLPNHIESFGKHVFSSCTSLETIVIPDEIAVKLSADFDGWTEKQIIYMDVAKETTPFREAWNCGQAKVVWGFEAGVHHVDMDDLYDYQHYAEPLTIWTDRTYPYDPFSGAKIAAYRTDSVKWERSGTVARRSGQGDRPNVFPRHRGKFILGRIGRKYE